MNILIYMYSIRILHLEQNVNTVEVFVYLTVPTDSYCACGHNELILRNTFITLLIDLFFLLYVMFFDIVVIINLV